MLLQRRVGCWPSKIRFLLATLFFAGRSLGAEVIQWSENRGGTQAHTQRRAFRHFIYLKTAPRPKRSDFKSLLRRPAERRRRRGRAAAAAAARAVLWRFRPCRERGATVRTRTATSSPGNTNPHRAKRSCRKAKPRDGEMPAAEPQRIF